MFFLSQFAGWPTCTAEQEAQTFIASLTGFILFIGLSIGAFFFIRNFARQRNSRPAKVTGFILLGVFSLIVCVGIPLLVAFAMTPWCT